MSSTFKLFLFYEFPDCRLAKKQNCLFYNCQGRRDLAFRKGSPIVRERFRSVQRTRFHQFGGVGAWNRTDLLPYSRTAIYIAMYRWEKAACRPQAGAGVRSTPLSLFEKHNLFTLQSKRNQHCKVPLGDSGLPPPSPSGEGGKGDRGGKEQSYFFAGKGLSLT